MKLKSKNHPHNELEKSRQINLLVFLMLINTFIRLILERHMSNHVRHGGLSQLFKFDFNLRSFGARIFSLEFIFWISIFIAFLVQKIQPRTYIEA